MEYLDELLTSAILNKKIALRGDYLMESVISESGEQVGEFELKNVCA